MITPYIPNKLFEVGDFEITAFKNNILVIDNWYKNYVEIYKMLQNTPVPIWKSNLNGRNFVDYLDCRPILNFNFVNVDELMSIDLLRCLIQTHFKIKKNLNLINKEFTFNYFKHINKNVSLNMQLHPHVDDNFNAIIFLDRVCSGGTAIYDSFYGENNEHINLLVDTSKYEKILIESKPNRLVLFNGLRPHGGYIADHNKYVDDWRINQVLFFNIET